MSMILLLGAGLESVSSVSMCCVWPEVRDWLVCWLFDFFKKLIVDGLVDWSVLSHSYQSAASVGSSGWEAASSPVPGCRCTWQRCHQSICQRWDVFRVSVEVIIILSQKEIIDVSWFYWQFEIRSISNHQKHEMKTHSAVCWRMAALDSFSPSWWGRSVRREANPG